jgi:WD40 repeat protein/biotin carboxyl carrier protein
VSQKTSPLFGLLVAVPAALFVSARAEDGGVKKASFAGDSSANAPDSQRARRQQTKKLEAVEDQSPEVSPPLTIPVPRSKSSSGVFERPLVIPQNQIKMPEEIRVPAEIAGVLATMSAQEGTIVKKDDVLARLDDRIAKLEEEFKKRTASNKAAVETAERRVDHYKAKLKREEKLNLSGGVSREEVEVAQAQYDLGLAELKDATVKETLADIDHEKSEVMLRRHTIRSPVNGVVQQRLKHPGEAVQAMEPIFHIIRTDRVKIQGQIEARYADRLRVGMTVEVWPEIAVGERAAYPHTAPIRCVRILPGDQRVAFGGDGGRVIVVNLRTGAVEKEITASTKPIRGLATSSAEPNQLVSCSEDGAIRFWNLADGQEVRPTLRAPNQGDEATLAVCLDPKNPTLGWTGHAKGQIHQWDFAKGVVVRSFVGPSGDKAHINGVTCLTVSPDGRTLLSVGDDQAVRCWKIADGTMVNNFPNRSGPAQKEVRQLNFSPDGSEIPCNSDALVEFKNLSDDVVEGTLESMQKNFASFVMMTPTPSLVLTASEDGELQLWQRAQADRPARLARVYRGHRTDSIVHQVDFSESGKFFVTCCTDRTVRVWTMPTTQELDAERLAARVTFVDPQAGPTGASAFHAEVDNRTGALKGNTTASVVVYPQ